MAGLVGVTLQGTDARQGSRTPRKTERDTSGCRVARDGGELPTTGVRTRAAVGEFRHYARRPWGRTGW
jgi:hypothetical protein